MSGDIVLSAALRNNLLSLQGTQRQIDTTQLRLATGLRVNSALDNPQNFFQAKSLNNRANDLTRLLDGISQSIRTIEQANTGVETLSQLLDQADSIALEAQSEIRASEGFTRIRGNEDLTELADLTLIGGGGIINDGVDDSFDLTVADEDGAIVGTLTIDIDAGDTVDNIVADINSDATLGPVVTARVTEGGFLEIASDEENYTLRLSESAAQGISAAGVAALGLDTIIGTEDDGAGAFRQGGSAIAGNTLFSQQAESTAASGEFEASQLLGSVANVGAGGAGYLDAGGDDVSIELTIDGIQTQVAASITDTDTIQTVIDAINNNGPATVEASFNTTTGEIEIEFDETVGQVELQFTANGASTTDFGFGTGAADGAVGAADLISDFFTFDGVNPDVDQFEEDFNNIRQQIDDLVEDANYRGVNLLADDNLTTFFNEDRDNTLTTEGVDFTALGLGIQVGDFTNAANVQLSIDSIDAAVARVRNFGQSIANNLSIVQFRRDFTEQTINTLKAGAEDLTIADQNEEGANLLALQTRQALGTTSLSLAAQSQQAVLRLF